MVAVTREPLQRLTISPHDAARWSPPSFWEEAMARSAAALPLLVLSGRKVGGFDNGLLVHPSFVISSFWRGRRVQCHLLPAGLL